MINSSNGINSLKEFIKEKDKFYDEEIESIINNIYINVEKQIDIISIEEFNNITLNSIYKIVINLKKIIGVIVFYLPPNSSFISAPL